MGMSMGTAIPFGRRCCVASLLRCLSGGGCGTIPGRVSFTRQWRGREPTRPSGRRPGFEPLRPAAQPVTGIQQSSLSILLRKRGGGAGKGGRITQFIAEFTVLRLGASHKPGAPPQGRTHAFAHLIYYYYTPASCTKANRGGGGFAKQHKTEFKGTAKAKAEVRV